MQTKYSEALTKIKEAREAAKALASEHITSSATALFERFPNVEAFRWNQYTPYFNDGEECTFGVNDVYLRFKGASEDDGENEDGFKSSWDCEDGSEEETACDEFGKLVRDMAGDDLKELYGDHVEVTATREGFTVEGYHHD